MLPTVGDFIDTVVSAQGYWKIPMCDMTMREAFERQIQKVIETFSLVEIPCTYTPLDGLKIKAPVHTPLPEDSIDPLNELILIGRSFRPMIIRSLVPVRFFKKTT